MGPRRARATQSPGLGGKSQEGCVPWGGTSAGSAAWQKAHQGLAEVGQAGNRWHWGTGLPAQGQAPE